MNNSGNSTLLKFLFSCAIVILIAGTIGLLGFGAGFVGGRLSAPALAPQIATHEMEPSDGEVAEPTSPPAPTPSPKATNTPEPAPAGPVSAAPANFTVFWEVLDHLRESFNGDVPEGKDITFAAVEGVMNRIDSCADDAKPLPNLDAPKANAETPANFGFFWDSVNRFYQDCGKGVPQGDDLTYAAAHGLIDVLGDKYTDILPPNRAEQFRTELDSSFEGIGATVLEAQSGGVMIVQPFKDSPAERAGLKRGDIVIAVDGKDVTDLTLDEAVGMIRGPANTDVLLTIKREGEQNPLEIKVTRARIDVPVVDYKIRDDNLLYVALFDFSTPATEALKQALQAGLDKNVKGIILDLRGNPGGRLDTAIQISSLFIKDGIVVSEKGVRNFEHKREGEALAGELPLAVLVDGGSASAAEIVAGAIQDYQRGVLVGEKTFGKGSVQSLFDLSDGSMLRVTTSQWYTPKGRQIDGEGLAPDILVLFDASTAKDDEDPQLDAAVKHLLGQED